MPRKWQVQLGPNFIKHNPICALILPRRLAAAVAPWEEEKESKRERERHERKVALATPEPLVGIAAPLFLPLYFCSPETSRLTHPTESLGNYAPRVTTIDRYSSSRVIRKKICDKRDVCEFIARSAIKNLNKLCARSERSVKSSQFFESSLQTATVTSPFERIWRTRSLHQG